MLTIFDVHTEKYITQSNLFNVKKCKNNIEDNTILKSYIILFKKSVFYKVKIYIFIMSVFL